MLLPPSPASPGYTLPVWLAAAARASVAALRGEASRPAWPLDLHPGEGRPPVLVPVRAAATIAEGWALAEATCDPGDGLDLTRGLLVWVLARWQEAPAPLAGGEPPWLQLEAGEGVGVHAASGQACLSAYARALLEVNLRPLVPEGRLLRLRVVLPQGRALAERTSNAAFGVVDGLALIGTRAETQASADPHQLDRTLAALAARLEDPQFQGDLILVIGENGLDLAPRLGLPADLLLKVGNWLGPVLVAAGQGGVKRLLVFGYQGKLIKLAGGIFHTHHHLADGRAEVLTALAALEGLSGPPLEALHGAPTTEAALLQLEQADPELAARLRARLAVTIEQRVAHYLERHGATGPLVGAALFDRSRQLRAVGPQGAVLLRAWIDPPQRGAT
ncbi:MAG: cobalt-precorrin-5B (C(1))-methyltransferase CbiD [Cyanobacteriota bacterium]|nr:cobalt-precorrin-5B (C(1))-methyltransferase CbiD [Cyanobacteriota bacterium]